MPRPTTRPPMWRGSADVNFVRAWSGGKDGDMLVYLERFERSLTTKRMISADDMQALSQVQFAEGPVFVLALVEAHLSAPPRFATPMGESTLMSANDYRTIGPGGKNRAKAVRAAQIMHAVREFSDAYTHVSDVVKLKHVSQLDCRLVMMAPCCEPAGREGRRAMLAGERAMASDARWVARAVQARCWARNARAAKNIHLWSLWQTIFGRPLTTTRLSWRGNASCRS